jgi:chaperonin GroEL
VELTGEEKIGLDILRRAIEAPLRQIAANAGIDGAVVVRNVKKSTGNQGYNALNDTYGDLVEMGVIDPAKVTKQAILNAASVASLLLTTACMIAEIPADDEGGEQDDMDY